MRVDQVVPQIQKFVGLEWLRAAFRFIARPSFLSYGLSLQHFQLGGIGRDTIQNRDVKGESLRAATEFLFRMRATRQILNYSTTVLVTAVSCLISTCSRNSLDSESV